VALREAAGEPLGEGGALLLALPHGGALAERKASAGSSVPKVRARGKGCGRAAERRAPNPKAIKEVDMHSKAQDDGVAEWNKTRSRRRAFRARCAAGACKVDHISR
jgi:hypothetical protein